MREGTPVSEIRDPLFHLLVRRSRGESRAAALLEDLSTQLGLHPGTADRVLTAIALIKTGATPESVSSLMTWAEFEEFCAGLLKASGYSVKKNILMTKPRRQIDIFAESSGLALSVDCKHWGKGFAPSTLERVAAEQIERTTLYKKKMALRLPVLPVILTLLDAPTRLVSGVPVVPIFALRDFLASVSRFEEGMEIL
jgi:restriction endonuclease